MSASNSDSPSLPRKIIAVLRNWATHSKIVQIAGDLRFVLAILIFFLLFSIGRILVSDLAATIRFLSFAVLSAIVGLLVLRYIQFSDE